MRGHGDVLDRYHDGGSGTCVPLGACSSGYHDSGSGECAIDGTCASGYHNDGTGTCVPLVACSASYHDGGDGRCVHDGSCSPGFHDGGGGTCTALGLCRTGYHDGGSGRFVAVGSCSLDTAGNQIGASAGSSACSPGNAGPRLTAAADIDFRDRTVKLGLETGKVYELAIFHVERHPPESNFQLTLQGFSFKRSICQPQ